MKAADTIREALERSWHSNGCATNVDVESGGGYCSHGCDVYEANAALASLVEVAEAARAMVNDKGFVIVDPASLGTVKRLRHALETIEGASPQKEAP